MLQNVKRSAAATSAYNKMTLGISLHKRQNLATCILIAFDPTRLTAAGGGSVALPLEALLCCAAFGFARAAPPVMLLPRPLTPLPIVTVCQL
jgi:hypothetical protein